VVITKRISDRDTTPGTFLPRHSRLPPLGFSPVKNRGLTQRIE
jgi:hypothetical protein